MLAPAFAAPAPRFAVRITEIPEFRPNAPLTKPFCIALLPMLLRKRNQPDALALVSAHDFFRAIRRPVAPNQDLHAIARIIRRQNIPNFRLRSPLVRCAPPQSRSPKAASRPPPQNPLPAYSRAAQTHPATAAADNPHRHTRQSRNKPRNQPGTKTRKSSASSHPKCRCATAAVAAGRTARRSHNSRYVINWIPCAVTISRNSGSVSQRNSASRCAHIRSVSENPASYSPGWQASSNVPPGRCSSVLRQACFKSPA